MRRSYTLNINLTNVGFVTDRSDGVLTETIMSGVYTTLTGCSQVQYCTANVEERRKDRWKNRSLEWRSLSKTFSFVFEF